MNGILQYRLNHAILVLKKGDITKFKGDAITNAANERMLGGGGVDGAIHRAAGPGLLEECRKVPTDENQERCLVGKAILTGGYKLHAKYVIHTVGPRYHGAKESAPLLTSAYKETVELAVQNGITTLALPAISCGIFGYPLDEASEIALHTLNETVREPLREVTFMLFGDDVFNAFKMSAEKLGLEPNDGLEE
eukprot:CAMPEP_0198206822 /NCGR_PEP_ID=MMETSP1445-20131203/10355_1 /TAXON_ID=36898 /ORGANISM="Pyramimonas sp., Strain CCMP2087" /LENGTH=192 /DNA_ID=CAMNT_0043879665 /DNA_START=228 /DNA_END=806 /DNA_ORIENTATION=-